MQRLWLLLVGVAITLNVSAASDISNSRDYERLQRFPSSYIVQYKQSDTRDYRLILGGLEKINGVLRPEKEKRIAGMLTQISYRIPENHTADEAFEHFYSQIIAQGGEALFRCSGRDCGSSNQWANNIFRYFRLYGVDNSQSFASLKLNGDHISLYSVRRGNKRVYLRLDILERHSSGISSPQRDETQINLEVSSKQDVERIIKFLVSSPEHLLWIVGHDFNPGTKQQQLTRSMQQAEQLKKQLVDAGISEAKIFIHAAGSFQLSKQTERGTKLMVYSEIRVE
jgi:hypothetical protein